jgi:hypothetical protein
MAYCVDTMPAVGETGEVHDTQKNPIRAERLFSDGNVYIYLKGVASTIAGSWVNYDEAGVTAGLDTDAADTLIGQLAIATGAIVANKFGWYGVKGSFSAGAGTVSDNGKVFPTSTVFICDDTGTGGQQVINAKWRSADSSSLATVEIDHPFVGVNVA